MIKRAFDLIGASLGLLLLWPLLLGIALAIKLDSPGPVLYRQLRVGRHGVPFRIHKFRTMGVDAAQRGGALTLDADARSERSTTSSATAPGGGASSRSSAYEPRRARSHTEPITVSGVSARYDATPASVAASAASGGSVLRS